VAGKGVGIEGERSGHWKHYARLIDETKPKGVIIENVSALLRRGLNVVLSDLHTLGYDAEWHCITAKHLGAYHERDRIWIIAYRNDLRASGFEPLQCLEQAGQGWESRKAHIEQMYQSPFGRSDLWPQPLLRRVDVQRSEWVDRIKQVGNTVYWPIVEKLGHHLHKNISES
jgi:DNA (cytosine-5)-methyltransferase 1